MTTDFPVATLLERSFGLLLRVRPRAWARFCKRLGPRRVSISLGNERFVVAGHELEVELELAPAERDATVEVHSDPHTILAVLDDELDLAAAVRCDRVAVRGALDDVAAVHDALVAYVHAGVRCPGFARLVAELRALLANDEEPDS